MWTYSISAVQVKGGSSHHPTYAFFFAKTLAHTVNLTENPRCYPSQIERTHAHAASSHRSHSPSCPARILSAVPRLIHCCYRTLRLLPSAPSSIQCRRSHPVVPPSLGCPRRCLELGWEHCATSLTPLPVDDPPPLRSAPPPICRPG